MVRLSVLFTVVFVLPTAAVTGATFWLLRGQSVKMTITKSMLVSVASGLLFLVATLALVSHQKVVLVAPGIVFIAMITFLVISVKTSGSSVFNRLGVALAVALVIVGGIEVVFADGFDGLVCSTILGDTTTYSPTYSADGFRRIQAGMNMQQVQQLVGDPLNHWTIPQDPTRLYWRWTESRSGSHYFRYRIAIFRNGLLEEKSAFFSCDMD